MNREVAENKMKKVKKIYQVMGITNANENKSYVFNTKQAAETFVKKQDFLVMNQIIEVDVHSFK